MTVLPNIFERYTSSLRILTSLLILKNGLKTKYLKNLSKIYTAEAYFNKNEKQPLDIENFCLSLLCAVSVIKYKQSKKFKFKINATGNFYINQQLFTVLILNLCRECEKLNVTANENIIEINFKGGYKKSLISLSKLKGFYFYCAKTQSGKIIIPTKKTAEKSVIFLSVWENIYDRFSAVNLFFENLL